MGIREGLTGGILGLVLGGSSFFLSYESKALTTWPPQAVLSLHSASLSVI
jgi:hypothetical protein